MKTFNNPKDKNIPVGEFTYEGCRYAGIEPGLTFSILSKGLAEYLVETFPWLVELEPKAKVLDNEYCCAKCGKDCGSKYMRERHEKVCTVVAEEMCIILKPNYIFWNYKNLDRTQLTEDQGLPQDVKMTKPSEIHDTEMMTAEMAATPMPGRKSREMIGKRMENVVIDKDQIPWYGDGVEDDIV